MNETPAGLVYGLRAWKVTDEGKLRSTNFDYLYEGVGPFRATHWAPSTVWAANNPVPPDHGVRNCESCGFHAYSTLEAAIKSCYTQTGMALGVVLMGGDIASAGCNNVDAYRFRAMQVMIVALQDDSDWSMTVIPSLEMYPVPRVPKTELELVSACMFHDRGRQGIGT